MRRDYAQRGLSAPDEATARESCLGEGVNAPNLATMKDFIRFYLAMSRGKIKQQPTADLVKHLRRVVLCWLHSCHQNANLW
jgi:hypothetical protein